MMMKITEGERAQNEMQSLKYASASEESFCVRHSTSSTLSNKGTILRRDAFDRLEAIRSNNFFGSAAKMGQNAYELEFECRYKQRGD